LTTTTVNIEPTKASGKSIFNYCEVLLHSLLRASIEEATDVQFKFSHVSAINWQCATSRKVVCSFPEGVTAIIPWLNSSNHTVALGSTQFLTEMSTRNISCR